MQTSSKYQQSIKRVHQIYLKYENVELLLQYNHKHTTQGKKFHVLFCKKKCHPKDFDLQVFFHEQISTKAETSSRFYTI